MGHFKIVKIDSENVSSISTLLEVLENAMNNAAEIGYDSIGTPQIYEGETLNGDEICAYALMYRHKESSLSDKEEDKRIYKF